MRVIARSEVDSGAGSLAVRIDQIGPVMDVPVTVSVVYASGASDDHLVKLWAVNTGHERATLAGHEALVTAVAFTRDEATLATAGFDRTAKLWDARTGRLRHTLAGHAGPIRALAVSGTERTDQLPDGPRPSSSARAAS